MKRYLPRLSALPSQRNFFRLNPREQEKFLDTRGREILLEIEGIRTGYYAHRGHSKASAVACARRKYRRLLNLAHLTGFWTDGRWNEGEEEDFGR
ncbi:MAG: hypothetical protein GC186_00120 [Rhodobacteraceae bacterium]|nr:hypothetical protein [Paracoccaceae bacterium]